VGNEREIRRDDFKKIVISKNVSIVDPPIHVQALYGIPQFQINSQHTFLSSGGEGTIMFLISQCS
jgi:hypothetical protein